MATFGSISSALNYPSAGTVEIITPTTGQSKTITDGTSLWIATPAGTLAALTVVMPPNPTDTQEIRITTSQIITALTLSPNTAQSVLNVPITLMLGGFCSFVWVASKTTWYRIS